MNAHAKINLALVVGPTRADGKHEVVTVLQRIELADEITLESADELAVAGFLELDGWRATATARGEEVLNQLALRLAAPGA